MTILYTRLLFWADGMALTPDLILIRPERKGDDGLLAHEQVHCDQMRKTSVLSFWMRYICSASFRQQMEVEAYQVSCAHEPHKAPAFAAALSDRYGLDLSPEQAMSLITGAQAQQQKD